MDQTSDAALIDAVIRGEVRAFAVLAHRYRDAYTRYATRMLGSLEDADDVLQKVFLRAYRSLSQCRERDRFAAWLYRIVVNECRTYATRRGRRERRFVRDDAELARALTAHPAEQQAVRDEIQRALDQLERAQREAFVLKHVEEMSYEEMADLTGVRISALKMRVKRACERLRQLLEGVHHE
jgi:RNA polymerase sigma-70 factor (ECF subfamily)